MGEGFENVAEENDKEEGAEVMDTPERSKSTQIAASISKFEDSPVFNFLNSLSPIKPVKSIHITQTINPLSFASLPSVFTSPHVTSLRESRFLRRHQLSDPSKPEFSSDEGTTADTNKVSTVGTMQLDEHKENVNPRESDGELAAEQSYDCSKFVVDFPEDSDCNSPDPTVRPSCGLKGKELADYASNSSALVPFVQNASQIDHNKEGTSCDWENLICEASDLLIFESPDVPNMHTLCVVGPSEGCDQESLSTQPGEGIEMINNAQAHDNPGEKVDYENLPGFYRGMRRRCLVFEMGGARRKHLDENSGSDDTSSSLLMQSDGNGSSTNDQKLVPTIKTGNESSRRVLPGIGLHLNALAATPKDYKIVTHDSSASGRLLIGPSSSVNFHSSNTHQEMLNTILPEREIDSVEDAIMPIEDASQASGFMANEEINQSSPKKKRRKADQPEEAGSCKRCNCKKSKCLKLYCECFAAGVYCVEPCACIDCFNKPVHEDTVLATRKQIESRNPLAFAPKVIRGADPVSEIGDDSSKTPASARHKRGCNCKKSGCLKKYCECYQGGVGCSINCRCEGCKNAFGRKDGSGVIIGTEAEIEEDETETNEKSMVEQNMDSAPPATPLRPTRQSAQLPFSSKKKPPRSSFPSIGSSSSGFYTNQGGFVKPSFFQPPPPPKFDKHFETIGEDEEMPDFLQGESSPIGGIKLSSPNRKRVSPPHNVGMSPGLRSSRKLILQSIPSFPSLTSNQ